MKSLKNILSKNSNFHSLNDILQESLRIGIDDKPELFPTTWEELRQIIKERFKELGPGTAEAPIDFNDIDVSNVNSFCNNIGRGLFESTEFEYIDILNWDVSSVENMCSLFAYCKKLKSVGDLSKWDVSKIESTSFMFYGCHNLKSIDDLSNWNVSAVENMSYMFCECYNLKSVGNLSNWNVSNVKNMHYMFEDSGITNIPDWYKE